MQPKTPKERAIYLAIRENKAIGAAKSARKLASCLQEEINLNKTHSWYSRKFAEKAVFLFLFNDQVITFQKIITTNL